MSQLERVRRVTPVAGRSRGTEMLWGTASLLTLATVVILLSPRREAIDQGTVALIMLVAPLVATLGSLRVALASGIISALTFNYFFTRPYESWHIEAGTSIVVFVIYLALATAVAIMMGRLRQAVAISDERTAHALLVRDLTIDLAHQNLRLQPPLDAALTEITTALELRRATLAIAVPGGERFVATTGTPAETGDVPSWDVTAHAFPIEAGSEHFGTLEVEPASEPLGENAERLLGLFANVVALACERAAFMQQAVERNSLEETDRLRVSLMQAVSHDLRTPLASISALASTFPDVGPLQPGQEQMLGDIVQQTERLARLVDQVLDVSRIESGSLKLRVETVQLDEVVRAAIEDVRRSVEQPITVDMPDDAPAVPVDELLVKQALVNLLENAGRYGRSPIEVSLLERDAHLELRIVDHGPGIPEATRRRLFEPTFAMRRESSDERSRGLGLVISSGFIAAHRGSIRVEPTPGGGATFVISLPKLPIAVAAG